MRFRNLTTDDRVIVGVGPVVGFERDDKGEVTETRGEFDLPEGFNVAGIAHQDIYEPADDEAKAAVAALLAETADEAEPVETPVEVKPTRTRVVPETPVDVPPTPEQENN